MIGAVQAEWTKLRTQASTGWLFIGTVAVTVSASVAVGAATHVGAGGGVGAADPVKVSLTGLYLGQTVLAVLAVLTVTEEYGTGMIRLTMSAIPCRLAVLAAKAANVAGLALLAGLVVVPACLFVGRLLLPGDGLNPAHGYALVSIGASPTMRAAAGSVLYLILIALLSLGIATAVRDTAVSIGSVLGVLYLPPILIQAVTDPLRRHLEQIAPMTAGLAVQATTNLHSLPLAPWSGLGVLAAWTLGSLLVGGLLLRLRDA